MGAIQIEETMVTFGKVKEYAHFNYNDYAMFKTSNIYSMTVKRKKIGRGVAKLL